MRLRKPLVLIFCLAIAMVKAVLSQEYHYILETAPAEFTVVSELLQEGEYDSLLFLSERMVSNYTDARTLGVAHFYSAQAQIAIGSYESGSVSLQSALGYFEASSYLEGLSLAYGVKANLFFENSQLDSAEYYLNQSAEKAEELGSNEILADLYERKALLKSSLGDSESAVQLLKLALQHASEADSGTQSTRIINQLSTTYHSLGMLDSAILYFGKGLELKHRINDAQGLISDYSALGNLFRERGEYESAQQQLLKALNIAEAERDSFSMSTIYSELGDIYAAQQIWDESESYYNRAIALARIKNSLFIEAGCLKKLGHLFLLQEKDSAAIESYTLSLELYSRLNSRVNSAEILMGLSQVYKSDSQFVKAKSLLLEALKTSGRSQDVMSTLSIELALAEIELKLGNQSAAIDYAEKCLQAYAAMGDSENLSRVYLLLSEAYSQTQVFQEAYSYYLKYSVLKDSLVSVERAEAIKKYDLLNTTRIKDQEIASQNEEIQRQQVVLLRKNNQVLLLAGGLGLIGLLSLLLFFVYNKNRQLNRQRIEVLKKEQETQQMKAIIEGEEKERKRFARELHDGLGAVLATVKMQISSIKGKVPNVESSGSYQKAEELIDEACRTVREVSHDLMPYVLEQQGLIPAVDDMCGNIARNFDMHLDFIHYGEEEELSDVLKITLYRIIQELLKNITKHAKASEVIVQLTVESSEVMLIVEDNGKGFKPSQAGKGIGLENIRSRAAYLNGTFDIESQLNEGSTFTIVLPVVQKFRMQ